MRTTVILSIFFIVFSLNTFAQQTLYTTPEQEWASINSVAFSPDGEMFASGGSDRTVRLWGAPGVLKRTFTEHTDTVRSVAFSPDGQLLASGSRDGTIRLWDISEGKNLKTLTGPEGFEASRRVQSVAFSPDGQLLASGNYGGAIHLWDANTGEHLKTFTGWTSRIWSVAFSPDGQILIGSSSTTIYLWDVSTGERKQSLNVTGRRGSVLSVAFSPNGRKFASGGLDSKIHLWDINTGENLKTLTGHADIVKSVTFSPDGQILASGSEDGTIGLWDVNTGENLKTLIGHENAVESVAFSPDGQTLVSGSYDETIRLWDVNTGENLKTIRKRRGSSIRSIAFSPDGQMIASRIADGTIRFWDVNTGEQTQILLGHEYDVNSIAFSPDGQIFASGSEDATIRLWDVNTGELLKTLIGHEDGVSSIEFSPGGQTVVSGSADATIRLWDVNTGEPFKILTAHEDAVFSVAFSPDGQTLASSGYDATIHLWDVNTGEPFKILTAHESLVFSVAFSPDGQTLASGGGGSWNDTRMGFDFGASGALNLWEVNTWALKRTLTGHTSFIENVAFSPDSQVLVSAAGDETIRLWDVNTGENLKTLTEHEEWVWSVVFSPNGEILASGGYEGTIRLWRLQIPTRVHVAPNPVVSSSIGEQFTINVNVIAGENVGGYQVSLEFDTSALRYVESANGDYLSSNAFFVPPVVSGNKVTLGATSFGEVSSGDGTLATVTFEVVDVKESVIQLLDTILTDSDGEHLSHLAYDAKVEEPSLLPSFAVVTLMPSSVLSPAAGEQLTFNVEITGGRNVADFQLTFDYDPSALEFISTRRGNYFAGGVGNGDGTLETVTFEVLDVKASTVSVSGHLIATNGLRYLPTFESAEIVAPIFGDVNRDGSVNILDLVLVASKFGQRVSGDPADVNEDGVVNIVDLVIVAGAIGSGAAAPSVWNLDLKTAPTRADVQNWLSEARQLNLTDATSQRGIRFLEQLLAALTPKETALLANYPNPFNPETWIPYQLAEPADVTVTIYAVDGTVVRTLELGHQPIGIYQDKSRAVYWDGRNEFGEPVASSVYFYTLTAGNFTATKKMLIRK